MEYDKTIFFVVVSDSSKRRCILTESTSTHCGQFHHFPNCGSELDPTSSFFPFRRYTREKLVLRSSMAFNALAKFAPDTLQQRMVQDSVLILYPSNLLSQKSSKDSLQYIRLVRTDDSNSWVQTSIFKNCPKLFWNEMSMLLDKLQQAGPFAVAAMGGGPAAELFAAAVAQLQRVFFCLFLTLRKISNHIFIQIFFKPYFFINL